MERVERETHIRNYAKVRKMIDSYYRAEIEKTEGMIADIERNGVPENSWKSKEETLSSLRELLREPKPLKGGGFKYPKSGYYAWWRKDLDRLNAADRAGAVREITCKVEWRRTRTWGKCPSCETWVQYDGEPQDVIMDRETGRPLIFHNGEPCRISTHYNPRTYADGCGYDKLSTVVNNGIQCPAIDRLVIENRGCWKCYAVEGSDCLPHLCFGGKGMSTLRTLFTSYGSKKAPIPGFEWEWQEGKNWDYIHIVRKRR